MTRWLLAESDGAFAASLAFATASGALVACGGEKVAGTTPITFASVGAGSDHTCGLTASGTAYCWGSDAYGALGDGTTTSSGTPVPVAGGLTFVGLSAGFTHTCGLAATGAAYCWGQNVYGALGDSTSADRSAPVAVRGGLTY